ncbi:MAG: autotransporter outer membrane beta-barrel domain-containing protein [Alphaproteobacteria bacterium]|nr:autotransporter outer membrane beta-barrel domain-containing protein [Alphaproteobacteria bacterium]
MKNPALKTLTATGVLFLASVAAASAADLSLAPRMPMKAAPMMPMSANPILYVNNQISLDAIGQNIDYLETDRNSVRLDSEKGWQPGLQITGSAMGSLGALTNVYIMGQFSWARSNTQYVGAYQGGTYGDLVQTNGAETKDFDFRLGKGFDVAPNWMFTPFFAAGYHVWDRNITGGGGYHEQYEHSYAGGGLMIQWAATNQLVFTGTGMVGSTFSPQMTSSLNGGFPITPYTYDLGSKLMWKAGLAADYALTQQWHLNAGFDYTHFNYAISNVQPDGSLEPDSRSGIWTVKAGFGYSFYQPTSRF